MGVWFLWCRPGFHSVGYCAVQVLETKGTSNMMLMRVWVVWCLVWCFFFCNGCGGVVSEEFPPLFSTFSMKCGHHGNDSDENGFLSRSMMNQSEEHPHEGANLDQSCRSTNIICYLKEDQSEFLEERRQKDLVNEFTDFDNQ